ncbi:hypothetical protein IFT66_21425 [Rhizobium sp. CFBP 13726]|uniref:hypothetical protein n=1 Tax=Rhizobium sp. CFBP 13726 TaxID=2775296 RepID=UPI001782C35F|nr:hypothetical protein [Rhizobium sp. CFBP 13726]MBD8653660.1 hypothetical protein [Rhizobium sp. CFBP 13726]
MTPIEKPYFRVKLSELLVESMTLAALEAYVLGDQSSRRNREKVETLGYIWGVKKVENESTTLFLDRMSVSLSAKRSRSAVQPHQHAAELKSNLMERWAPHLMLLGDFHTHPYDDLNQVKKISGWDFSPEDINFLQHDDFLWKMSGDTPVNLVMTVTKLGKVRERDQAHCIRENLWEFDAGEFRFWLNVNVGYLDILDERQQTFVDGDGAFLDLNTRFYNMKGDRIAAHI